MGEIALTAPAPITTEHDVTQFSSGESSLNDWLKKRAIRNQTTGASKCFVLCAEKAVVGYYTLSAGAISREWAPKALRRNSPDILPVLLLGRLAIDQRFQNQGLGRALLRDALIRSINVASEVGVSAILVHAISEPAKRFYLSSGFVESPLQPMTLLMTIETVRRVVLE